MKTSAAFLLLAFSFTAIAQPPGKRMLVVSGGGARGAWSVGLLDSLKNKAGHRYDFVVGTSTGALIAPFALFNDPPTMNKLETAYTSVNQREIFNRNPFNEQTGELKGLLWLATHAFGRTLGRTENLKKLIETEIDSSLYRRVREEGDKNFAVAVVNLRTHGVAYKFARPCAYFDRDATTPKTEPGQSYQDMTNWIWASCNQPVFMSLFETDTTGQPVRRRRPRAGEVHDFWADGGTRDNIPVVEALKIALSNGFDAVDVLINSPVATVDAYSVWPHKLIRGPKGELPPAPGAPTRRGRATVFSSLFAALTTFRSSIRDMNVGMGGLLAEVSSLNERQPTLANQPTGPSGPASGPNAAERALTLKFYFLPDSLYRVIPNDLLFDKNNMKRLLRAGQRGAYSSPSSVEAERRASGTSDPQRPRSIAPSHRPEAGQNPAALAPERTGAAREPLTYTVTVSALKEILQKLNR